MVLYFQTLRISQLSINSTKLMPPGFDNFSPSCTQNAITSWFQDWRVFGINCQRRSVIVAGNYLRFTSVFCSQKHAALSLSDIPSEIQKYRPHNEHKNKTIQKRVTVRITITKLKSLHSAAIQFP